MSSSAASGLRPVRWPIPDSFVLYLRWRNKGGLTVLVILFFSPFHSFSTYISFFYFLFFFSLLSTGALFRYSLYLVLLACSSTCGVCWVYHASYLSAKAFRRLESGTIYLPDPTSLFKQHAKRAIEFSWHPTLVHRTLIIHARSHTLWPFFPTKGSV